MIKLSNLRFQVQDKVILKDLNFSFLENSVVDVIVGPNGAGKSSVVKAVLDLIDYEGRIESRNVQFSYAGDNSDIDSMFSVNEILDYASFSVGTSNIRKEHIVNMFDLALILNNSFNTLSGGEKKRVLLACSLYQKSDVIIWDEPTNYLDPRHVNILKDIINEISKERKFIIVSHDLNFALNLSSFLFGLKNGELAFQADLKSISGEKVESDLSELYDVSLRIIKNDGKKVVV